MSKKIKGFRVIFLSSLQQDEIIMADEYHPTREADYDFVQFDSLDSVVPAAKIRSTSIMGIVTLYEEGDSDDIISHANLLNNLSPEKIDWFAHANGAMQVWKSWLEGMTAQEREVMPERMNWETLPLNDRLLDLKIAKDVLTDFAVWATSHPHKEE